MQFMRILITGGFGYLGGRLAQYFIEQGHEVYLGTRREVNSPYWLPQADVVQNCWDDPASLELNCSGMDVVIHAAGMNAEDCVVDPVTALYINGIATARMLRAAIRQGVKRFIYLSTAHVYGSPLAGTITEETCPVSLHPYATSHRAGEDVVRAAHQRGEIEGVVIRLSNAYGAPAHKDANCWMLLVNDLCRQAVSSREMILHSSGMQRRDFVPFSDVCRAVEHLFKLSPRGLGDGLFNLGGDWAPTVWEMSCLIRERCEEVLGFLPQLTRVPLREGERSLNLDFQMDTLLKTGFELKGDRSTEIGRILMFCKDTFV